MLGIWTKVMVKECQPDAKFNEIIYSDNHWNYKFVEWIIVSVLWDNQDKYILDFDRDIIFWEDMLQVVEEPLFNQAQTWVRTASSPMAFEPTAIRNTGEKTWADAVRKELSEYRKKIDAIEDRELYFNLYEDKLESLLRIYYGW